MAADRGALPALVEPNEPANPLNPTPAAVGRQFDHSRKLGARRGKLANVSRCKMWLG
jgi:hypothetical protein